MKKQAMLTAVAGLLTFASVAVLPAFAQDTGGQSYKPMPRQEYSRYGGNHERQHDWGSGSYGYRNNDHGRSGSGTKLRMPRSTNSDAGTSFTLAK